MEGDSQDAQFVRYESAFFPFLTILVRESYFVFEMVVFPEP